MEKLTGKQEMFVQELIKNGGNQRQAYLAAYPRSKTWLDSSVDNLASKLLKNTKVLTRFEKLKQELLESEKEEMIYTRKQARDDLLWIKEMAKNQIIRDKDVKKAPSDAYLTSVANLIKLDVVTEADKVGQNIKIVFGDDE